MAASDDARQNCWEYMRCGREPGGQYLEKNGPCPAATVSELDGIHGGVNGGRACWVVAGTLCKGAPHGSFAQKGQSCHACPFYRTVVAQEMSAKSRTGFMFTTQLLRALEGVDLSPR
jgi:hypothetical protein